MALRVIYRSYGGDNDKRRPQGFSKLLSLVSFLQASRRAGSPEVVFLNDGPVPEPLERLMRDAGEVVELPRVGMRGSYSTALRTATSGRWADDDVVWFAEDDYLYAPGALEALQRAASDLAFASYFALYGSTRTTSVHAEDEPDHDTPGGWSDIGPVPSGGHEWVRIFSTTSTFGARVGALREDLGIFRLCMVPHRNMLRDHDTCLAVQGARPWSARDLLLPLVGRGGGSARQRVRHAALAPFYAATSLRAAVRRPSHRRVLMAPEPNLVAHMEIGRLAPGTDWTAVAEQVRAWGVAEGLLHPEDAPSGR